MGRKQDISYVLLQQAKERSELEVLRGKANFLEIINDFSSLLLRTKTVDDVIWAVAKHAVARMGFVDCVIYMYDEDREFLIQRAAHGPKNPEAFNIDNPMKLKRGQGICGHVAITGVGEIVHDTLQDYRYRPDDAMRLSEITVPIVADGQVLGIIDSEAEERNYFTEEQLEILTTIAAMAALKINEALATEKLKRYTDQLELIVEDKTHELQMTLSQLQESFDHIKKSNVEKETLLKEIHHRVKNNLQILYSLLNMHIKKADNENEMTVFQECQHRILSMASIHEHLYAKGSLVEIDLKMYIEEMCTQLISSYRLSGKVDCQFNLEQLFFDLDTSIPLGLLLNEILTNTLKHAFKFEEGVISVCLTAKDKMVSLTIKDNGVGFIPQSQAGSMGFELIETLTDQLEGEIECESGQRGTVYRLKFPIR